MSCRQPSMSFAGLMPRRCSMPAVPGGRQVLHDSLPLQQLLSSSYRSMTCTDRSARPLHAISWAYGREIE